MRFNQKILDELEFKLSRNTKLESWTEIYKQLEKADQDQTLDPSALEKLAVAAYLTGRDAKSFEILERAHKDYLKQKNTNHAIHCAFWLGLMLINAGERARGSGWITRGERLVDELNNTDCAEKELLLIPKGIGQLAAGHSAEAQKTFQHVVAAGERFHHVDLIALGRLGMGQAMIKQGEIASGVKLLDETMITLETENVFPLVNGIVYCSVIEICRKVWDLERAQEWTASFSRWCDSQPDLVPFRGECRVRRAEIFQFHGEWPKALKESVDACHSLTETRVEPAAREAYYLQAELHRLVGNFEKSEYCYQESARLGKRPQPGLALLRLMQGKVDDAKTSIRNTLQETTDPKRRAELLPAVVNIMLATKKIEDAHKAAEELCNLARDLHVPYLLAMCSYCRGSVLYNRGNAQGALDQLQKSLKFWNTLSLPYESACTQELKGRVYQTLQDKDNSESELMAAKWVYEQLGAKPDLERVNRLLNKESQHEMHGLSLRELQVLRLVASGKTNKSVADELFISERTVDRHMSNIFNKLGVSSRVEASTFALTNQMLD